MGHVSEYIKEMVAKQVKDNHLVVWFDPDEIYGDIVAELEVPEGTVTKYRESFFELRHDIAPLMSGEDPPDLLIYVPLSEEETDNALIPYTSSGIVLKPHQTPWQRNTRLGVIANQALKDLVHDPAELEDIIKKVDNGVITLADLDTIAERVRGSTHLKVLSLIYGVDSPQDITLSFLNQPNLDEELIQKKAMEELKGFLCDEFGAKIRGDTPEECRTELARYLLVSAFEANLEGYTPEILIHVPRAQNNNDRQACANLVHEWQMRRDLQESYIAWARRIEHPLGVRDVHFDLSQIKDIHTFQGIDKAVLTLVETALLTKPTKDLEKIAHSREHGFWAEMVPTTKARWHLVATIAEFLNICQNIETEMKGRSFTASEIISCYTHNEHPWCYLDTLHRYVEKSYFALEYETVSTLDTLGNLYSKVRQRYMEIGGTIASKFVHLLAQSRFDLADIPQQNHIVSDFVLPAMEEGKVAYFLVDALRYEMGRELIQILPADNVAKIEAAQATVPTITEIGMASLVLKKDDNPSLVGVGSGKIALRIRESDLKDRASRLDYFGDSVDGKVISLKLGELMNPSKSVQERIRDADLILVTSQEIDEFAEQAETYQARRYMDDVLHTLRRAFHFLSDFGVSTIIVTADHGYLFGEEADDPMKIPPPGGETVDLHRRVWVGRGGAANESYCYFKAGDIGLEGDLEIAVPYGFGVFKVQGGGLAYFHGGLSPQEYIIPLITILTSPKEQELPTGIQLSITLGSKHISRISTMKIEGKATTITDLQPPKIRVEIRSEGNQISQPLSALYGYEQATGDVQLKMSETDTQTIDPNTVTLLIPPDVKPGKTATILLLDANTGVLLKKLENIPIEITF